jgi:phosphoglycerol transferase
VLFLLFHVLPALWTAAALGRPIPSWMIGSGLLAFLVHRLATNGAFWGRLTGVVASGSLGLLSVGFAISYYFQDGGFNAAFFYHADVPSIRVGHQEYGVLMYSSLFYILCSAALPLLLPARTESRHRGFLVAAALVGLATYTPIHSLLGFLIPSLAESSDSSSVVETRLRPDIQKLPTESAPRNIILIYGESIEQLYFEREIFGDLLPRLTELRDRALVFDNIRQVGGTTWTIAGLVASQCALPLNVGFSGNTSLASIDVPYPAANCFADVLRGYGYETVYLNGAGLDFAGKGNFLRAHGFAHVLGRDELAPLLPDPNYIGGWGLYDDSLFELAKQKLGELQEGQPPFLLTVLTLDTHHPNGNPSASCRALPGNENPILDAVHCTDQIVGRFIDELMSTEGFANTIVAFVSDHLSLRNTAWDVLTEHRAERRLTFFVLGPDIEPGIVHAQGTPFDIGPTLLELAGLPNYHEFNLGSSLMRGRNGYWYRNLREARELAKNTSFVGDDLVLDSDVVFDATGPSIRIGDRSFRPNFAGYALNDNIYGIVFDDERRFVGFASAETLDAFESIVGDDFVVAVSKNREFIEHFGGEPSAGNLHCFAGFPTRSSHMLEPVTTSLTIPSRRIQPLFETD